MRKVLILLLLVGVAAVSLDAQVTRVRLRQRAAAGSSFALTCTQTAASASGADVQTALDAASAEGSVVCVPADDETWTAQVTWTAPANAVLLGAGALSAQGGPALTVIRDGVSAHTSFLSITGPNSGTVRIAGIKFIGGVISGSLDKAGSGMITLTQPEGGQLRVDHSTFDNTTYSGGSVSSNVMVIYGCPRGVIDSNRFTIGGGTDFVPRGDCGASGKGHEAWAADTGFGSAEFMFYEDNWHESIVTGGINDCYSGANWVVRYNTIIASDTQGHGTGHAAADDRGCRAHEMYRNTITTNVSSGLKFNCFFLASGTAVVWGNDAGANNCEKFITAHINRRNNGTYTQTATPDGWGYCGTSFNGTGSNWDGNTVASTGYPCIDQVGRGKGQLITGSMPTAVNASTGTIAWPNQALEPVYAFFNTWSCSGCGAFSEFWANFEDEITQNREYYLGLAVQTSSSSPFDGTKQTNAGMGYGTIANRPSTCTTGVAYWATDEGEWDSTNGATADGKMYVCTATDTWTARYGGGADNTSGLPYTYPHPLRN